MERRQSRARLTAVACSVVLTIVPLPNGVSLSGEYRKAEAELQEGAQICHFIANGTPNALQLTGIVSAFVRGEPAAAG
jgi:hypothetical protein